MRALIPAGHSDLEESAMYRRSMSWPALLVVGLAIVLGGCSAAPGGSGGAASGNLSVYSALNESTNNAFIEAFQKAYPNIKVEILPLAAAGELQTRIRTEKSAPKADIFIGGSSEFHDPLGKEGLLEPYKSPNAADVDAGFKH